MSNMKNGIARYYKTSNPLSAFAAMKKTHKLGQRSICSNIVLSIVLYAVAVLPSYSSELDFKDIDKNALADILFNEIERLDASAIEVRNQTKQVKWHEFRAVMRQKIIDANDKKSLAQAIESLHQGFTNSHSSIQTYPALFDIPELYNTPLEQRGFSLGYTYPKVEFFLLNNQKSITHINGFNLHDRFNSFEQYECQFTQKNACLNKFVSRIGYGLIDLRISNTNQLQNGSGQPWLDAIADHKVALPTVSRDCASYANEHPSFQLTYSSSDFCLLDNGTHSLLKVFKFGDWGAPNEDFYCYGEAKPDSFCDGIQKLSGILATKKNIQLIVDVQDNPGGSENTPLVALLSKGEFKDSLIKYKFTKEMHDANFRKHIFYGNKNAENWFNITQTSLAPNSKQTWLPARADFCRANVECKQLPIARRQPAIDIKKLTLVVNSACASSCDDLVIRLKQYASAHIVGQRPVFDTTYVSATGVIFMDHKKQLKFKIVGPGQSLGLQPPDTKLVWFIVPYTLSLDPDYRLDIEVPVTKDNFLHLRRANVSAALSL